MLDILGCLVNVLTGGNELLSASTYPFGSHILLLDWVMLMNVQSKECFYYCGLKDLWSKGGLRDYFWIFLRMEVSR